MLTKENQVTIIKQSINNLDASIYDCIISKRVADKVKDEQMSKNVISRLEKIEKMRDEYQQILNELNKESDK